MIRRLLQIALVILCACSDPRPSGLTLWHAYNGDERAALEAAVAQIEERSGIRIVLVSVPHETLTDKVTNGIPNGNGPDLFIFAHDRIGNWAESQLVEPIEYYVDDTLADHYSYQSLSALSYRQSLYGLPMALKSYALFYRRDLIDEPPKTTDELIALRDRLPDSTYHFIYDNKNLYGHAAWLHGHGADIVDGAGELRLVSPEAVAALEFARTLERKRVVPKGVDGKMVATLFNEGKAAMAMSGPWFLSDIDDSVDWGVTTLPTVSSTALPARPYLGVEGILMSARARDKDLAFRAMRALTGDSASVERALRARQVVPNVATYDDPRVRDNAALSAFRAQSERAVVMPSTPLSRMVWTPYETAIVRVIDQNMPIADALRSAEGEVRSYFEARD